MELEAEARLYLHVAQVSDRTSPSFTCFMGKPRLSPSGAGVLLTIGRRSPETRLGMVQKDIFLLQNITVSMAGVVTTIHILCHLPINNYPN